MGTYTMRYMDIDLDQLHCVPPSSGKRKFAPVRYKDGTSVMVQTPACRVAFPVHAEYGTFTIDMDHVGFCEFLRSVDTWMERLGMHDPGSVLNGAVKQPNPAYPPNMRIKIVDGTSLYGPDNERIAKESITRGTRCIVLLELGTAWAIGGKHGVSWKAKQIKIVRPVEETPSSEAPTGFAFIV